MKIKENVKQEKEKSRQEEKTPAVDGKELQKTEWESKKSRKTQASRVTSRLETRDVLPWWNQKHATAIQESHVEGAGEVAAAATLGTHTADRASPFGGPCLECSHPRVKK